MLKRIALIIVIFQLTACAELQQVINQLPNGGITNDQIANGLKEALNNGITNQVSTLAVEDGFFKNELTRILLPEELQKVDKTLRSIGLSKVADEGLKVLNRAAEDAVSEAIPIFVDAIKGMTFADAKNILLGDKNAATNYLQSATSEALYQKFNPIIQQSFQKVGADKIWTDLITKYNNLPLTNDVNPDLTDYVTGEALKGVFTMVEVEEKEIRANVGKRTTDLLRTVFALQD
ncbi:MAG: DUF4197 domain-containing protein [Lutibacter sp.]|uniref:DUF4197 domain-containing protein n=1 Tax=Lutibacter sp. TaxID=1925666 RepID=UPI0017E948A0|nr:DUF4197 domain-containing protein [Lutibacter sp.]MBT8318433.1 DUF4197 domain-containing protein [Lutibacter sp.]NNJ59291.1 DUF4197 domain-containing protein [Lutibacter sp.]